jgi:putative acetyltransferase
MAVLREERPDDAAAVRRVHEEAFGTTEEADLAEMLSDSDQALLSFVALDDAGVIGHILFSPVTVGDADDLWAMGLGPMAVAPQHQQRGVGSALVRHGLEACRAAGYDAVVVLGWPTFYQRFDFVSASTFGLTCEFDSPDEAFMAIELRPGALRGRGGLVRYASEFGGEA